MNNVAVSFDKGLKEFHANIILGSDGLTFFFDDFKVEKKYGQLLLKNQGEIVGILNLNDMSGIARRVLERLEEIRKQDEAPEMGADSSQCHKCKAAFDLVGNLCRDCLAGV